MKVKKIYKSIQERIDELNEIHNSEVPENVKSFWLAIDSYADVNNDLGAQGNSGEFYDESEQKRLEKEFEKSQKELLKIFSENTGYLPVLLNINEEIYFSQNSCTYLPGFWKLEKI